MMRCVTMPTISSSEAFEKCSDRVADSSLKAAMQAISTNIDVACDKYQSLAPLGQLHDLDETDDIGTVSAVELNKNYTDRLVPKGKARYIYDHIMQLPPHGLCPFCCVGSVNTLDHLLPKANYTAFAVSPTNLVACCSVCNTAKGSTLPVDANQCFVHPYFENVDCQEWLFAEVVEDDVAALKFSIQEVSAFSTELNARLQFQFEKLNLNRVFSGSAASELASITDEMIWLHNAGGNEKVRLHLRQKYQSCHNNLKNGWRTATYRALFESDWYCDGGFNIS